MKQNGRLRELVELSERRYAASGVSYPLELRSYQPKSQHRGCRSLHTKCFRVDADIYIGGSYNPTQNATQNNEEHVVVLRNLEICRDVDRWFDRVWSEGHLVTTREIDEISERLEALKQDQEAKK
jgi:phosphatidylserine/phosphatidylglycerophosphate/cardiolipin synthase-like enzyme